MVRAKIQFTDPVESPTSSVEIQDAREAAKAQLRALVDETEPAVVYAALSRHAWSLDPGMCEALGAYDRAMRKPTVPEGDKASIERNKRVRSARERAGKALLAWVAAWPRHPAAT